MIIIIEIRMKRIFNKLMVISLSLPLGLLLMQQTSLAQIWRLPFEAIQLQQLSKLWGSMNLIAQCQEQKILATFPASTRLMLQQKLESEQQEMPNAQLCQLEKQLEALQQMLSVAEAIPDQGLKSSILLLAGGIYADAGQPQKALEYYTQALPMLRDEGNLDLEALTLSKIGNIYADAGQPEKALEYYNQALPMLREGIYENTPIEAMTLFGLARMEGLQGNLQPALTHIEAAITILENLRQEIAGPELRVAFLAANIFGNPFSDYYRLNIDLLMQLHKQQPNQGYNARAFQVSERARARALRELLNEAFQDQSQPANPRFPALNPTQSLALAEIQQQVLDDNTLLLEYSLGKDRSYLWAVSKTSMSSYELPKATDIEKLVRQLRTFLTDRNYQFVEEQMNQVSGQLSQMLLGPVAGQLEQKRLVIVGDGSLEYLPFAALPIPQSTASASTTASVSSLIVNHEIINLPSASTLAILRKGTGLRTSASKAVIVLADPIFSREDPRIQSLQTVATPSSTSDQIGLTRSAVDLRMHFDRLPHTRLEAEAIAKLFPPDQQVTKLDFAANLSNATDSSLSQYQIVHFATHGFLDSKNPALSGIVLSLVNEKGEPENGFLRLKEIFNLKLNADLVVLSACETGLGEEIHGEGLVGLTRGFMYAGAPRVIVSLWNVNDQATSELMTNFYRGFLSQGLSPAAALRQAQRELMQQQRYQAPYYWAAFALQGEWK